MVNTAGVLPAGRARRDDRGDDLRRPPRSTTWRRSSSPRSSTPHLAETEGSLLLFTSSSYTRGRGGYSLYSSAKAAVVNLTQALADEWAGRRRPGQLRQPGAHRAPRCAPRRSARSRRAPCSTSRTVAEPSLDVLISGLTGQVIDVRREDKLADHLNASVAAELLHEEEPGDVVSDGVDPVAVHGG